MFLKGLYDEERRARLGLDIELTRDEEPIERRELTRDEDDGLCTSSRLELEITYNEPRAQQRPQQDPQETALNARIRERKQAALAKLAAKRRTVFAEDEDGLEYDTTPLM